MASDRDMDVSFYAEEPSRKHQREGAATGHVLVRLAEVNYVYQVETLLRRFVPGNFSFILWNVLACPRSSNRVELLSTERSTLTK